ncbi:F-box/kelch-repeat protein [Striga hermonthica]|uniref:F-box/kelch-repeat protein n=1 Tax=Striga hermonthica TaxID=68872 RepID=A0A9N7N0P6_STRHE|nr:F-box/kelch-repeat protein [Striga hermonthica]
MAGLPFHPQFIRSHIARTTTQQHETLILISPFGSVHTVATIANGAVSRYLDLPDTWTELAGSCDGLALLARDSEMLLLNPITLDRLKIPDSPLALMSPGSFSMHGLGYDRVGDDYKVVTLSYYDTDNEYEPDCEDTFVDVYSVKSGVWKRAKNSSYDHAVPDLSSGVFVNGALHWLASSRERGYPSVIAAFDLSREVFYEIPPPKGVNVNKFVFDKLFVLGGCLCMVEDHYDDPTDVWVMKEYGSAESWAKFSINAGYEWELMKVLCFVRHEEVLLLSLEEDLVVYNWEDETEEDIVIDGVQKVRTCSITHDGTAADADRRSHMLVSPCHPRVRAATLAIEGDQFAVGGMRNISERQAKSQYRSAALEEVTEEERGVGMREETVRIVEWSNFQLDFVNEKTKCGGKV